MCLSVQRDNEIATPTGYTGRILKMRFSAFKSYGVKGKWEQTKICQAYLYPVRLPCVPWRDQLECTDPARSDFRRLSQSCALVQIRPRLLDAASASQEEGRMAGSAVCAFALVREKRAPAYIPLLLVRLCFPPAQRQLIFSRTNRSEM